MRECKVASIVSDSLRPYGPAVTRQAPLSMRFCRQEYWSGLPFLLQGIFPTQGLNLGSLDLVGTFFTAEPPGNIYSELRSQKKKKAPRGTSLEAKG